MVAEAVGMERVTLEEGRMPGVPCPKEGPVSVIPSERPGPPGASGVMECVTLEEGRIPGVACPKEGPVPIIPGERPGPPGDSGVMEVDGPELFSV